MRRRKELGQPGDIAFLLIIFFLLLEGIPAARTISLAVESSEGQVYKTEESVTLTLTDEGTLAGETGPVSEQELSTLLNPLLHLTLRVESDTSWQSTVDVLSLIEQKKIASFILEEAP